MGLCSLHTTRPLGIAIKNFNTEFHGRFVIIFKCNALFFLFSNANSSFSYSLKTNRLKLVSEFIFRGFFYLSMHACCPCKTNKIQYIIKLIMSVYCIIRICPLGLPYTCPGSRSKLEPRFVEEIFRSSKICRISNSIVEIPISD